MAVEANYRNIKFSDPIQEFKDFKVKFGKSYKTWDEQTERFEAFKVKLNKDFCF